MKYNLFISTLSLFLLLSACANKQQPIIFNARYEKCINDPVCPAQERLVLANEMADYLRYELRRMNRHCIYTNYEDCFSSQSDDLEQWHKINNHMLDIMKSLE